jgi:hypothetical protein
MRENYGRFIFFLKQDFAPLYFLSLVYPQLFTFILGKHSSRGKIFALFFGLFIIFEVYNDLSTTTNRIIVFIEGYILYGLGVGIYIIITYILRKIKSTPPVILRSI